MASGMLKDIIGNIKIADDIVIGANALVNKSFLEKGIVIAGVPILIPLVIFGF